MLRRLVDTLINQGTATADRAVGLRLSGPDPDCQDHTMLLWHPGIKHLFAVLLLLLQAE